MSPKINETQLNLALLAIQKDLRALSSNLKYLHSQEVGGNETEHMCRQESPTL